VSLVTNKSAPLRWQPPNNNPNRKVSIIGGRGGVTRDGNRDVGVFPVVSGGTGGYPTNKRTTDFYRPIADILF
jgi:hypothetical protein